ncbi:MAG: FAD-dependent monooxygenase [Rhizobiaceae bacterium]|nr:FAD-dependent monooxygenase [Rhizobiaceae bacterium]
MGTEPHRILIAGAGVAGLSAALCFAQRGAQVAIFERALQLEEVGAGLQLSPNATRILSRLGVLDELMETAVEPDAVVLRRAEDLHEIARVPLGRAARARWGAPYLVSHRADLQRALLNAVSKQDRISLHTGMSVEDIDLEGPSPALVTQSGRKEGRLVIGADGVWSTVRSLSGKTGQSRFIGQVAWRRTFSADAQSVQALVRFVSSRSVTAILHSSFHMIVYPVKSGTAFNVVAFTPTRREMATGWSLKGDHSPLTKALEGTFSALSALVHDGGEWLAWPIHVADLDAPWSAPSGLALIGDAAHAMSPFAAQGAATAIEDAATLASQLSGSDNLEMALQRWTIERRRRVLRVARRGAFNQFVWHARGPAAIGRDLVLRLRSPESLMSDLDWLYGWDGA